MRPCFAARSILDTDGEKIVRKALDLASDSEPVAFRLVLDRLVPPRRERRIAVDLSPIATHADAVKAAAIVARFASGELTMSEGESLTKLVSNVVATLASNDQRRRCVGVVVTKPEPGEGLPTRASTRI